MGITAACTVIEFIDGIKSWNTVPLQGGELGNFMSQSIAASLKEKAQEGVASAIDQLLLYLSTIDKCLIPKEEYSHLCHLGGVPGGFWEAWDQEFKSHFSPEKKACVTCTI